jgi:hypothetical protein
MVIMDMFVRWELLELFDQERIIDKESETYEYILSTYNNMKFRLCISTFDEHASIMLQDPALEMWIFGFGLEGVTRIKVEREMSQGHYFVGKEVTFLSFFQHESTISVLRVLVKPMVSLQYSISRSDNFV